MKVKELIEKLQTEDPESKVIYYDEMGVFEVAGIERQPLRRKRKDGTRPPSDVVLV